MTFHRPGVDERPLPLFSFAFGTPINFEEITYATGRSDVVRDRSHRHRRGLHPQVQALGGLQGGVRRAVVRRGAKDGLKGLDYGMAYHDSMQLMVPYDVAKKAGVAGGGMVRNNNVYNVTPSFELSDKIFIATDDNGDKEKVKTVNREAWTRYAENHGAVVGLMASRLSKELGGK